MMVPQWNWTNGPPNISSGCWQGVFRWCCAVGWSVVKMHYWCSGGGGSLVMMNIVMRGVPRHCITDILNSIQILSTPIPQVSLLPRCLTWANSLPPLQSLFISCSLNPLRVEKVAICDKETSVSMPISMLRLTYGPLALTQQYRNLTMRLLCIINLIDYGTSNIHTLASVYKTTKTNPIQPTS